jgi:hypothetical protein
MKSAIDDLNDEDVELQTWKTVKQLNKHNKLNF